MKKFIQNVISLRKYFQNYVSFEANKPIPKLKVLSNIDALSAFAKLWEHYQGDVMTMNYLLEYEFMSEGYTEDQMRAVKKILLGQMNFLKECAKEIKDIEEERERNKRR